ncbi:MAG: hypothetical protein IT559_04715 [Alphaproteobacteria bacterium]|nr:hypothetical protein [Alphaproteobacteria bacterium]
MHTRTNSAHTDERGNALWFILIGVVLIGALTMILSRGGSNVEQSGNVEQLRVKSSQLLRYGKSVQIAIEQMKLRGVSENDISFENGSPATNVNAKCTNTGCKIFDAGGGGLTYRNFESLNDATPWIFTGANNVGTTAGPIGTTAAGSGNDLVMLLPNTNQALCLQINRDLNVGTAGTIPVDSTGIATTAFDGNFPAAGPIIIDGDGAPFELDGHEAGCFTDSAPDPDITYFYYVVLAR